MFCGSLPIVNCRLEAVVGAFLGVLCFGEKIPRIELFYLVPLTEAELVAVGVRSDRFTGESGPCLLSLSASYLSSLKIHESS